MLKINRISDNSGNEGIRSFHFIITYAEQVIFINHKKDILLQYNIKTELIEESTLNLLDKTNLLKGRIIF